MSQKPHQLMTTTISPSDLWCASCTHSAWHKAGLICKKQPRFAVKICQHFQYEPGTDEEEKNDPCSF